MCCQLLHIRHGKLKSINYTKLYLAVIKIGYIRTKFETGELNLLQYCYRICFDNIKFAKFGSFNIYEKNKNEYKNFHFYFDILNI